MWLNTNNLYETNIQRNNLEVCKGSEKRARDKTCFKMLFMYMILSIRVIILLVYRNVIYCYSNVSCVKNYKRTRCTLFSVCPKLLYFILTLFDFSFRLIKRPCLFGNKTVCFSSHAQVTSTFDLLQAVT